MARNQFMTKKWDIEKLMAKREGAAANAKAAPQFTRNAVMTHLFLIEDAIKRRTAAGETWSRYWSQERQDYVYNEEARKA